MSPSRTSRLALATVVALLVVGLVPAVAEVLAPPAPDPVPKVAFVARNDNPADALAVGPVAGALGGVLATTPSTRLSDEAEATLTAFAPEVVYVAGGTAAITAETYEAIDTAGPWETRRLPGTNRDDTARLIALVLDDLGVGRPLLTEAQVVGDAWLGGTLTAEMLEGAIDLPPSPITWATRDTVVDSPRPAFPTDLTAIQTLEVDVPADGVLTVRGSVLVYNRVETGARGANATLLLDPPATLTTEGFYAAAFGTGNVQMLNDTGIGKASDTLTVSGSVAVTEGTHEVAMFVSGTVDMEGDLSELTVTWTPGEAPGPGIEVPAS